MNQFTKSEEHSHFDIPPNVESGHTPAVPPWSHHTRSNNSSSHHYTNPHHYQNSTRDCSSHYYNDIPNDNGYLPTVSGRVDGDFYYYFNDSPASQKAIHKQRRDTRNLSVKSDGKGMYDVEKKLMHKNRRRVSMQFDLFHLNVVFIAYMPFFVLNNHRC
nr:unnamed protein product [Callosobruchus chinensis]